MRFYTNQHQFYCGIDLHARLLAICIVDQAGNIVLQTQIPADKQPLLKALAPFRPDAVVAVECLFAWYWVADLCRDEKIPFVLGHALYMKAIHGGKAKNDDIDAEKIARLLKGPEPTPRRAVEPESLTEARQGRTPPRKPRANANFGTLRGGDPVMLPCVTRIPAWSAGNSRPRLV